jgi:hypothetical protein
VGTTRRRLAKNCMPSYAVPLVSTTCVEKTKKSNDQL